MKNQTLRFRRLVAVIVLPTYLAACTSWRVQETAPAQLFEQEQPTNVRATLTDGTTIELENPRVSGDRLIGVRDGLETGVSLSTVEALAVREPDTGKTIGVVLLSVVAVVGVLAAVAYAVTCDDIIC